jgi:flagellar motor switch protein FliN
MAEPSDQIGNDEIEALLRGASGGAPAASKPMPSSSGADGPSGNVSQNDIELLLRKAEQALASIDEPAGNLPPHVQSFKFADFSGTAANAESATLELMRDVELDLTIELGRTHMQLEDVLKLKQGAVVPLDKLAGDPADIYVNGRLIARGEVLVLNDNFCVRVAELIVGESACA